MLKLTNKPVRRPVMSDVMFADFFNDFFHGTNEERGTFFKPAAQIVEHKDSFELKLSLPGMKKEDVVIDLNADELNISGTHAEQKVSEDAKYHLGEIIYGKFSRTFRLPDNVNAEKIEALMNEGILTITIPKGETAKPKQIKIK